MLSERSRHEGTYEIPVEAGRPVAIEISIAVDSRGGGWKGVHRAPGSAGCRPGLDRGLGYIKACIDQTHHVILE